MAPDEARLTREIRALLKARRTAALGTIDEDGGPFVSMVPFAVDPSQGCLVIHVSGLAAHTRHLHQRPRLSLLVIAPEVHGKPVHALPRVTLDGAAEPLEPGGPEWKASRDAYLKRFPEAEPMTQLGDFRFVAIHVTGGRHVAGFGAARDVDEEEIQRVLRAKT